MARHIFLIRAYKHVHNKTFPRTINFTICLVQHLLAIGSVHFVEESFSENSFVICSPRKWYSIWVGGSQGDGDWIRGLRPQPIHSKPGRMRSIPSHRHFYNDVCVRILDATTMQPPGPKRTPRTHPPPDALPAIHRRGWSRPAAGTPSGVPLASRA